MHNYSLIHDDPPCMDDDDLRRGKPTNHKVSRRNPGCPGRGCHAAGGFPSHSPGPWSFCRQPH
ncbi:MAG: polyprenyl synthetase family protein [Oscillospiraceae bacterium]